VVKPVHLILANSFYSGRQLVYRHGDFVELKICQPSILCFFYRKSYFPIREVRMDPYVLPNEMD